MTSRMVVLVDEVSTHRKFTSLQLLLGSLHLLTVHRHLVLPTRIAEVSTGPRHPEATCAQRLPTSGAGFETVGFRFVDVVAPIRACVRPSETQALVDSGLQVKASGCGDEEIMHGGSVSEV